MNKNKLVLVVSFFSVITALLLGCVKDEGKLPVQVITVSACDTVTYNKHIKPIIDANCLICHGTTLPPGAPLLTNYAEVQVNGDKIKNTVFDSKPELMPQGGPPLPQAQKDLIMCWLNNGKKE
jgi:hypothetical protein